MGEVFIYFTFFLGCHCGPEHGTRDRFRSKDEMHLRKRCKLVDTLSPPKMHKNNKVNAEFWCLRIVLTAEETREHTRMYRVFPRVVEPHTTGLNSPVVLRYLWPLQDVVHGIQICPAKLGLPGVVNV